MIAAPYRPAWKAPSVSRCEPDLRRRIPNPYDPVQLVPWRLLPGKPGGSAFGVIAGALDLVDEILHVGGKAAGQEYADVKPLCRGMLFGLVEPGLEVLQGLDALSNYWVIHASPPLWCDIPSKAACFGWHRLAVAHYDALVDHGFAVRPTSRQNRRVGNAHRPLRPRDRCVG